MAKQVKQYVVAIDAGTTSVRVVMYNNSLKVVRSSQQEFAQHYPQPGWVEHDAEQIWRVTERLLNRVIQGRQKQVASIGITNQRETVVVWNTVSGKPIHRAIVWQDRRTADACARLRRRGHEPLIQGKTGLVLDPYFSGSKIAWLLDAVSGARAKARAGLLKAGTIDSWLVWKLTNGVVHATDYTNASRTMLLNVRTRQWDTQLCRLLRVPKQMLPTVLNSGDDYGSYNGIPITGVVGDQQAALFGQGGVTRGSCKNTYGTGCFLLMNVGKRFVRSRNGLLTTLALDAQGRSVYALEGSVFMGGALIQWLRDEMEILQRSSDAGRVATSVPDSHGVVIVPAFTGLGAPYWKPEARGVITGLTRGANWRHIVRAAEEAIAFQVMDVVHAMEKDAGVRLKELTVDGGAARDDFLLQFQADLLRRPVVRPADLETTARGAAMLAGLYIGFWSSGQVQRMMRVNKRFMPKMKQAEVLKSQALWLNAIQHIV